MSKPKLLMLCWHQYINGLIRWLLITTISLQIFLFIETIYFYHWFGISPSIQDKWLDLIILFSYRYLTIIVLTYRVLSTREFTALVMTPVQFDCIVLFIIFQFWVVIPLFVDNILQSPHYIFERLFFIKLRFLLTLCPYTW